MKSTLIEDTANERRIALVICNMHREIVYMNMTAIKNYEKLSAKRRKGKSLLKCHNLKTRGRIE